MRRPLNNLKNTLSERIDLIIKIAFGVLVALCCYYIVEPFGTAILISAMICVVTWPFFLRLDALLKGKRTLSSLLMVTILIVLVIIPVTILIVMIAKQISAIAFIARDWVSQGMPLPDWLLSLPWVGEYFKEPLAELLAIPEVSSALKQALSAGTKFVFTYGSSVVYTLVQVMLIAAIAFVFYRNGEALANKVQSILDRVGGGLSSSFRSILVGTTRSVVFGIFGTALGQAALAYIGFWICGIENQMLFAFLVFIFSAVPMGPPLIWGPVAVSLYLKGDTMLAVFLVLWGTFVVSSVDNFLKPVLISKGTPLPMALVFLGVFGGLIAFGFLGIFLGPVFLALGSALFTAWLTETRESQGEEAAESGPDAAEAPEAKSS